MRCLVVVKVVVAAGKAGTLLVHSFGQGSGMRWWGLPGDRCHVRCHVWGQMAVDVCGHEYWVVWEWQVLWGRWLAINDRLH